MNGTEERLCWIGGKEKVSVVKDEWMLKSRFPSTRTRCDNKVEIAPETIYIGSCDAEYGGTWHRIIASTILPKRWLLGQGRGDPLTRKVQARLSCTLRSYDETDAQRCGALPRYSTCTVVHLPPRQLVTFPRYRLHETSTLRLPASYLLLESVQYSAVPYKCLSETVSRLFRHPSICLV